MKTGVLKKGLLAVGSVFLLLTIVIGLHIYMVTHKPMDPNTVAMARIDFKQEINKDDADKITSWLAVQPGVSRVLVNEQTNIAVFTFHPAQVQADKVVNDFKNHFDYKAVRYVPSESEMKGGCPVAATSLSYKAYQFIKHIF